MYEAKSVEEWLRKTNYVADDSYIASTFALEFVNFIKLVNGGEGEENKTPVVHLKMLDAIVAGDENQKRIANLCHRGMGKTSLLEYLILFIAFKGILPNFGLVNLMIYVSDSMDNGVRNMRKNLENRYDRSDFLKKVLNKPNFTMDRWEFQNIAGHTLVVKGYGAKTGVRGTKEMGTRPQIALLDDLLSDDDARSKTVCENIKVLINSAIEPALHPRKSMIIWAGTPFHADDPLYTAVESGAWRVNVYPICERFPCTKAEFRGSWEDRFSYEYVKNQYERAKLQGKVSSFNQEYMLQIQSTDDRLVLDTDINWYDFTVFWQKRNNFNFYITTDWATSESESADYNEIDVWAVNHLGQIFWVDGIHVRQTMDKNLEDLFSLVQKYNPIEVGVEITGQQYGFVSWINQEMMRRNIYFKLASSSENGKAGIRPTTNKLARFNVALPLIKQGKLFFPTQKKDHPVLAAKLAQLYLVCVSGIKSKFDDFIDSFSQLPVFNMVYPNMPSIESTQSVGIWGSMAAIDTGSSDMDSYIV